jgi:hypothetical protein
MIDIAQVRTAIMDPIASSSEYNSCMCSLAFSLVHVLRFAFCPPLLTAKL